MMNRRHFLDTLGVGSLVALAPMAVRAATLKRVIVVGGGMAGATAAKYLRLWSNKTVDVTLVDTSTKYVSNIMSNLVVTGQYAPTILDYGWSNLVKNHGVKLLNGTVTQVEPGGSLGTWKVTVTKGTTQTVLYCERVVLAPGVKFDAVPSTGNAALAAPILHAWEAGTQTTQLRDFLAAMPPTGTFVLTIPKAPYRCPPGPYERACVVADYLKRNKPGAQIVVLDANQDITAEKESFSHAFSVMYGSNLSYRTGRVVKSVSSVAGQPGGMVVVDIVVKDASGQDVVMGTETYDAQVLNVIPPHRAGAIVHSLGLADATGFAPVDGRSFESTVAGKAGIHVIGDASKTSLPKAGHVGNQGAKICVDAILRAFSAQVPYSSPTANSACFSPLSNTLASWLTAVYQYQQDPASGVWKYVAIDQVSAATGATEARSPSTGSFSKMGTWYRSLMTETFS
jgi:NADPH-dependent 2,4-dienoyl-CoA reductase/sulfur reductase-like enzyme